MHVVRAAFDPGRFGFVDEDQPQQASKIIPRFARVAKAAVRDGAVMRDLNSKKHGEQR